MKEIITSTPIVHIWHKRVTTNSLNVTTYFGKRHKSVLRAIQNLECPEEFMRRNFAPIFYQDSYGRKQAAYEITRDGFAMLAFGFTGKQAAMFKVRYIEAFNRMLEGYPEGREEAIQAKRVAHRGMTDAIQLDKERQGKTAQIHHFTCENRLCNWAAFGKFTAVDEGTLTAPDAKLLERVRNYNETLIIDGLDYQARKAKLEAYAERQRAYLLPVAKLSGGAK